MTEFLQTPTQAQRTEYAIHRRRTCVCAFSLIGKSERVAFFTQIFPSRRTQQGIILGVFECLMTTDEKRTIYAFERFEQVIQQCCRVEAKRKVDYVQLPRERVSVIHPD